MNVDSFSKENIPVEANPIILLSENIYIQSIDRYRLFWWKISSQLIACLSEFCDSKQK